MYQLHNWSLLAVIAQGLVFGRDDPKMPDGAYTTTLRSSGRR